MIKWFIIALIIGVIAGFILGFEVRDRIEPDIILMDMVQVQEYLNEKIEADPWIAPELLEVDGVIGPATVKAWERASAMGVGI